MMDLLPCITVFSLHSFLIGFHLVKKCNNESAPAEWMDKLVYAVLGTIIGARLGHVFFYEWDYYAKIYMKYLWYGKESQVMSCYCVNCCRGSIPKKLLRNIPYGL